MFFAELSLLVVNVIFFLSDCIRRKRRSQFCYAASGRNYATEGDNLLLFWKLQMIGIDVGLGVHAEDAIVGGGEDLESGRDGTTAVVGGLSFGTRRGKVQDKEIRIPLRIIAMLFEPRHDRLVLLGMIVPSLSRRQFSIVVFRQRIHRQPIVIEVHFVQK